MSIQELWGCVDPEYLDNGCMENNSASSLANKLGRNKIASAVGVGLTAVSNATVSGKFPSSWFEIIEALCVSVGEDCPRKIFNFKTPSKSPQEGVV
jgi:hypothetical protein